MLEMGQFYTTVRCFYDGMAEILVGTTIVMDDRSEEVYESKSEYSQGAINEHRPDEHIERRYFRTRGSTEAIQYAPGDKSHDTRGVAGANKD